MRIQYVALRKGTVLHVLERHPFCRRLVTYKIDGLSWKVDLKKKKKRTILVHQVVASQERMSSQRRDLLRQGALYVVDSLHWMSVPVIFKSGVTFPFLFCLFLQMFPLLLCKGNACAILIDLYW